MDALALILTLAAMVMFALARAAASCAASMRSRSDWSFLAAALICQFTSLPTAHRPVIRGAPTRPGQPGLPD